LILTGFVSLISFVAQLVVLRPNLVDLYGFRQTQTAFTIREYMAGNWSINTPLPTLGPPWTNPFEFPLFEGIAAVIGQALGLSADTAGRITGLLFFIGTGILLAVLIRRWFGFRASLITLVLFQATPFAAQWASASLIEFAATAFVLGAVVAVDSYSRNKSWPLLLVATGLLTLGFAVKVTTAIAWALVFLVAALGVSWRKAHFRHVVIAGIAPLTIALGAGLAWTRFADSVKEQNPIGAYLTSDALRQWNFGTLLQRTNLDQWDRIFERLPSLGASIWIFAVLLGVALWRLRLDLRLIAFASVPLIAILIFFNLYVVHSYYLGAVYPAYVAVLGISVAAISRIVSKRIASLSLAGFLSLLLILLAWTSTEGRSLASLVRVDGKFPEISRAIAESTPTDAGVIVVGCDWDPTPLFYAERRGMTIPPWYRDGIPADWIGTDLKYLAFCTGDYQVSEGDPGAVLPNGSLFSEIAPGIFIIGAPAPWFGGTYRK
jgi:hypothetical protein